MMLVRIVHKTGELTAWNAPEIPRVGDTLSFTGSRHDCRKVVRVDWGIFIVSDGKQSAAQLEEVRVFVD